MSIIRGITRGVKNLWRWKDIIWRDRDWDWAYLYSIMEFKLEMMANYHSKHGLSSNSETTATQMREAAGLLRTISRNKYFDNINPKLHNRFEKACKAQDADLEAFGKMFIQRSRDWWN